jgi:hypothetical protein
MLTEDDLRSRLHTLADPVRPAPNPVADVRRRVRVLRRRRAAANVALAVVVVLALGFAAGFGPMRPHHPVAVPGSGASPTPSAPPAKAPDLAHLRSAQQVWPDAVHLLPATLSDGRGYDVYDALGDGRYLITIAAGFDLVADIAILDTRHGDALTVLSVGSAGHGASEYQPQQPVVTKDGVAWVAFARRSGQWTTEIWASALTAGSARLVTTLPGRPVTPPALAWVVGDQVLFQEPGKASDVADQSGAIYSVPRSGGQPREIVAGYYALSGAWVTTKHAIGAIYPGTHDSPKFELYNVVTGARIPVRVNPTTQAGLPGNEVADSLVCAPTWCAGQASGAGDTPAIGVQHPDGGGYVQVRPAWPTTMFGGGRFLVGYRDLGNDRVQDFIWDVVTGAAGTFGAPADRYGRGHTMRVVADPAQRCYTWPAPNGKFVLDATALG